MAKDFIVTVDSPKIRDITIFSNEAGEIRVEVRFQLIGNSGVVYLSKTHVYWEVLPPELLDIDGNPILNPPEYKQMPPIYAASLGNLVETITQAISTEYEL